MADIIVPSALASPGLVAIDEFHRAPEMLSYVKRVLDRRGGAARFLLAGSVSSCLLLPPRTETLTDRDLPDLIDDRHSGALTRRYRLIAQRASATATNTELANALDVSQPTAASYRSLLERLYLRTELPGWTVGVSAKPGHRAKVHVTDRVTIHSDVRLTQAS